MLFLIINRIIFLKYVLIASFSFYRILQSAHQILEKYNYSEYNEHRMCTMVCIYTLWGCCIEELPKINLLILRRINVPLQRR